MMELPTFNEGLIMRPTQARPKIVQEKFDRKLALEQAPEDLVPVFRDLFRRIDTLDLTLNYYDLRTGKRKKEPRKELLSQFSEEEQRTLQEKSTHINPYQYLKMRHELVDLRRQQFPLKDSYSNPITRTTMPVIDYVERKTYFEEGIPVFPLGL